MKNVLVCPPDHFQIEYEINPWMHVENQVDPQRARIGFNALINLYQTLGVTVHTIPQKKGLPDMVFAANFGFVVGDLFIRSNFKYPQRRGEEILVEAYFRRHGFRVATLPEGIFFEGQGDMFYAEGRYFCGYGKRTSKEAIPYLEQILNAPVIAVETRDPYYYHFDTCFAPIGQKTALVKTSSFSKKDTKTLTSYFKNIIDVPNTGIPLFGCNVVAVGSDIVAGQGIDPSVVSSLNHHGFTVHQVPMDEFLKSGGAVKCLTLEWFAPS